MKSVETIRENMHFVLPAELRRKNSHPWLPSARGAKTKSPVPIGAATASNTPGRSCGLALD